MATVDTVKDMPRKRRPSEPKLPEENKGSDGKVVIYLEVDPRIKQIMEDLAIEHNRRLTGECTQALQEYMAKYNRWPPGTEEGE